MVQAAAEDFDLLPDLRLLERYRDDLVARLEENDSPALRTKVLGILEDDERDEGEKIEDAIALLQRGVAWDQTMRKVAEMSERTVAVKTKGMDILLRQEVSLPATKVMLLFQQFIRIVREVTGSPALTRQVIARTYRDLLGAEPRMALLAPESEASVTEAAALGPQEGEEPAP